MTDATVTVRLATPDDLPAVGKLAAQLVRFHHKIDPQRFMLVEPIEDGYRWWLGKELENQDAVVTVAVRSDGTVLGYAYGRLEERDWNQLLDAHGALHDIFVDETARRRGVARALLDDMVARLAGKGAPRVLLSTAWDNTAAQALFQHVGFRKTMIEMTRESP